MAMAAVASFAREERLGLGTAVAAHLALFAFLALYEAGPPARLPTPERMDVSLASEVSLTATSPNPAEAAQAAIAPELAPEPVEQTVEPVEQVEVVRQPPKPMPTRPVVQPSPRPAPAAKATPKPPQRPQPAAQTPARPTPAKRAGGSRIGSDFLDGTSAGERTQSRGAPAAAFGPAEQASLQQAINRQLKPHWNAPQGVDAEKLVTVLRWELNDDGTLKGRPEVVSQSGINDSNRAQASLHAERAIRAVQLAAPFELPPQFYDKWKRIREWRFDRRL